MEKLCKTCQQLRLATEFYRSPSSRDGLYSDCRSCYNARNNRAKSARRRQRGRSSADRKRSPEGKMLETARQSARRRGLCFDLDVSDIKIPATCPCLGIELKRGNGVLCDSSPSLDRIDSSIGYTKGNVWVISMRANRIKHSATMKELEDIVSALKNMRVI